MDAIIEAKGIIKKYGGITAVDGVDFSVRHGECFGVLGPNGAGKTSLTKMLYHLVRRDSGSLSVVGYDPQKNETAVKYKIGIVPQEDNLDSDLLAAENLEVYSNYFGMNRHHSAAKIKELFHFFELEGRENFPIHALSGGMKRRLILARALLNDPQLLILDEPTIGLDPAARHLIWNKFRELKDKGITILLTTHYMEEASHLCSRLIIMDKGRIILEGNPARLMKQHFEAYVLETECQNIVPNEKKVRCECHGNRQYVYSDDESVLFSIREMFGAEQVVIRNATLEDLFLKLTGRALNE